MLRQEAAVFTQTRSCVLLSVAVLTACSCLTSGCSQNRPAPAGLVQREPPLPPLIQAAANGEPEQVRHLLDAGADVNMRSNAPHERTAMQAALYHRQNDIEHIVAMPGDVPNGSRENPPVNVEDGVKDANYREVIGMLRQAALDARNRTHINYDQHHRTPHHA